MRPLKFRQPRLDKDGKFIDWFYWGFLDDGSGLHFVAPLRHDVENYQFTGLHDKKRTKKFPEGQEIYGGDIVKAPAMAIDAICCEVYWDMNCWCIKDFRDSKKRSTGLTNYGGEFSPEVIGDIHTTPDLMENGK